MIKQLSISGFRGFGVKQEIPFAIPDGETPGSGLTIITGANNSGKTTILESIRAFNNYESPSFSEGRRNIHTQGSVELKIIDAEDKEYTIKSVSGNSSSTTREPNNSLDYYVLQSRRSVPFEFSKNSWNREEYIRYSLQLDMQRNYSLDNFSSRIFEIEKNKNKFNEIINKILGNDFQWSIELRDSGQYYIKYTNDDIFHSSEGIGDGIWSIFTICASLFDAEDDSTIVIDEPELSVHPTLQKRLMNLFIEYSKNIQLIICTHSPYFIDWNAIASGAQLIRVVKEDTNSICYNISKESQKKVRGVLTDLNNPHVLGINANEAFFLEDEIILVEGQEDVVIFNKIAKQLSKEIKGNFFGWGVGGAPKMDIFMKLFKDLGFKKVVAIYDGDKEKDAKDAENKYPDFSIIILKEDDIRDKRRRTIKYKKGITDIKGNLKKKNRAYATKLIDEINGCFS